MKKAILFFVTLLVFSGLSGVATAQEAISKDSLIYKVIKHNGVAFTGRILSQDAREVLVDSQEIGQVFVPRHEIKEIQRLEVGEKPITGGLFSTRYFLTTNGFPIKKGDNYVQWNLFGPDFQFGVADNLSLGIMTSWVGIPIVGTAKYSRNLGNNLCGGIGLLAGTGSWAFPEFGLALPFGFISAGTRVNNVNFSAGYGMLFYETTEYTYQIVNTPTEWSTNSYTQTERTFNESEGRPLLSIAGMFRLNSKFSFVFDSFIMLKGKPREYTYLRESWQEGSYMVTYYLEKETNPGYALIVLAPGLRFQATEHSSFQFGFTGLRFEGEFVPVPIPMVQWFRRI